MNEAISKTSALTTPVLIMFIARLRAAGHEVEPLANREWYEAVWSPKDVAGYVRSLSESMEVNYVGA